MKTAEISKLSKNIETSLYESVGIFNSLNSSIFANDSYTNFAIQKILNIMKTLDKTILEINKMPVEQAKVELAFLETLKPELKKVKKQVKSINDADKFVFKTIALDFFKSVKKFKNELEEVLYPHAAWQAFCKLESNQDWNHPDNDHWDTENY